MSLIDNKKILIIEPDNKLLKPYDHFKSSNLCRIASIEQGIKYLSDSTPDIVFISTSFSIHKTLHFLDTLKNASMSGLIPLVFVINLSEKISYVPGTTWAGKIGIIHSLSSAKEINSTIQRVLPSS